MKRIIIWGIGKILQSIKNYVDWESVMCLVDSSDEKIGSYFEGKEIKSPQVLAELSFEKVVVFTTNFYFDIYDTLVNELGIVEEKVAYWSEFLGLYNIEQTVDVIMKDAADNAYKYLYDAQNAFMDNHVYLSGATEKQIQIIVPENLSENVYPIYRKYMTKCIELMDKHKTAVFLGRKSQISMNEIEELLGSYGTIYFTVSHSNGKFESEWSAIEKVRALECQKIKLIYESLCIISKRQAEKKIKLYIATHKEFVCPQDDIYEPLWLGKTENNHWGYQEDKAVPEISDLNPLINECTGLYWMWKHAREDYVGLVHYRRYFLKDEVKSFENVMDSEKAFSILEEYDMITTPMTYLPLTVSEQLQITIEKEAFENGMNIVEMVIKEKQPDYLEPFYYVFSGNTMFSCNMFITSKVIFDNYCEWLFSIIIDAAKTIDVTDYAPYSKRIIGFIAERLFTVWLIKQDLNIKEMPVLVTEQLQDTNTDITRLKKGK